MDENNIDESNIKDKAFEDAVYGRDRWISNDDEIINDDQNILIDDPGYTYSHIDGFMREIRSNVKDVRVKTGFPLLDKALGKGLKPALYLIASGTGFGKTTFALQMADNIAKTGRDCIFFSIEMGLYELMAKSTSRLTCEKSREIYGNCKHATHADGILEGWRWQYYDNERRKCIDEALDDYVAKISRHMRIEQCHQKPSFKEISDAVNEHINITGRTPVIFIDYIQLIRPDNAKADNKQNMDKVSWQLRRMARDFKTPIICISSLNRDAYRGKPRPYDLSSFKESGGLEYNVDMPLVIEHQNIEEMEHADKELLKDMMHKAMTSDPRPVRVKMLKNRSGNQESVNMKFYRCVGMFEEETS